MTIADSIVSVHEVFFLRYACSQNSHLQKQTIIFRAMQALKINFLNQTNELIINSK